MENIAEGPPSTRKYHLRGIIGDTSCGDWKTHYCVRISDLWP